MFIKVGIGAAIALIAASAAAEAPRLLTAHPSALPHTRPANTCFGGLENGKHLLEEADLHDLTKQTTPSGCAEAGGQAGWLPRFNPPVKRLLTA